MRGPMVSGSQGGVRSAGFAQWRKAMLRLSGDHAGCDSLPGSAVSLRVTLRPISVQEHRDFIALFVDGEASVAWIDASLGIVR